MRVRVEPQEEASLLLRERAGAFDVNVTRKGLSLHFLSRSHAKLYVADQPPGDERTQTVAPSAALLERDRTWASL